MEALPKSKLDMEQGEKIDALTPLGRRVLNEVKARQMAVAELGPAALQGSVTPLEAA